MRVNIIVTSLVAGVFLILLAVKPPRIYSSGPVSAAPVNKWAALADSLKHHEAHQLTLMTLLAIELNYRSPSPEYHELLRQYVALLAQKQPQPSPSIDGDQHQFSPNGQWLATVNNDQLRVWDTNNGQADPLNRLPPITDFAFSHNSSWLVTRSDDQTIRFWDVITGQKLGDTWVEAVESFTLSPNNQWLLTTSQNRPAQLWEIRQRQPGGFLTVYPNNHRLSLGQIKLAAFSSDGHWLATSYGSQIQVWHLNSGQMIAALFQPAEVSHLAFSPDSQLLVTADYNTAQVWRLYAEDVTKQKQAVTKVRNFGPPSINAINGIVFSPNSRQLVISSQHQAIIHQLEPTHLLLNTDSVFTLTHQAKINALAYSSDGRWLATASEDKTARIWDTEKGNELKRLPHNTAVRQLAFDPTDRHLTTVSDDQAVHQWQPMASPGQPLSYDNGTPQIAFQMANQEIRYLTLEQVCQVEEFILMIDRADKPLRIWIAAPGQIGQMPHINDVVMIPLEVNGLSNSMAPGWDNGSVVEEVQPVEALIEIACNYLKRNLSRAEWQTYFPGYPYRVTCANLSPEK